MKVKYYIKNFDKFVLALLEHRLIPFVSDEVFLRIKYRILMKKKLNIDNPGTYNEKIQWLKLNDKKTEYSRMVDKYAVKEYVANLIGEEYIIPTIGIWNKFEEIVLDELPERFVLKCTHDSGGVVVCSDKSTFDVELAKEKLTKSLKRNYFWRTREWPYKNIKPRIIAEKYIDAASGDLKDYKLMCFNGKVKCVFVCSNRNTQQGLNVTFFDLNWNRLPFERKYPVDKQEIHKPVFLKKMIGVAEILAKDITFVRIDFYENEGKLYFGEMTFYPGSGFEEFNPEEWDGIMGSWLELPDCNEI